MEGTAGLKTAKCISCIRKLLVKECTDGFKVYIDVRSEGD